MRASTELRAPSARLRASSIGLLGAALGLGDGGGRRGPRSPRRRGAVGLGALQALRRARRARPRRPSARGRGRRRCVEPARSRRSRRASRSRCAWSLPPCLIVGDGALEVGAQARRPRARRPRRGRGWRATSRRGLLRPARAAPAPSARGRRCAPSPTAGAPPRRRRRRGRDRAALDAGVGVGRGAPRRSASCSARAASRGGELLLDPRGRLERAEDDERAGRAPALPGLRLGLERLAQRAHDDRVLLAHAQQHQVHRQLEAEVLEEEREVEALVELDGDEDGLDREAGAPSACMPSTSTRAAGVRRVAGLRGSGATDCGVRARAPGRAACSKNDWPRTPGAGRPNSSSAGSDHLETEPWPSVRTK